MKTLVLMLVALSLIAIPPASLAAAPQAALPALASAGVSVVSENAPAALQADARMRIPKSPVQGQAETISLASASLPVKVALALLVGLIGLLAFMPFFLEGNDGYPEL